MREYQPYLIEQFDMRLLNTIFDFLDKEIEKDKTSPSKGVDVMLLVDKYPQQVVNFFYNTFSIGASFPLATNDVLVPFRVIIESGDGHYELLKEM